MTMMFLLLAAAGVASTDAFFLPSSHRLTTSLSTRLHSARAGSWYPQHGTEYRQDGYFEGTGSRATAYENGWSPRGGRRDDWWEGNGNDGASYYRGNRRGVGQRGRGGNYLPVASPPVNPDVRGSSGSFHGSGPSYDRRTVYSNGQRRNGVGDNVYRAGRGNGQCNPPPSQSNNGYYNNPPSQATNGYYPPSQSTNGYYPPSQSTNSYYPPSQSTNSYYPPSQSTNGYYNSNQNTNNVGQAGSSSRSSSSNNSIGGYYKSRNQNVGSRSNEQYAAAAPSRSNEQYAAAATPSNHGNQQYSEQGPTIPQLLKSLWNRDAASRKRAMLTLTEMCAGRNSGSLEMSRQEMHRMGAPMIVVQTMDQCLRERQQQNNGDADMMAAGCRLLEALSASAERELNYHHANSGAGDSRGLLIEVGGIETVLQMMNRFPRHAEIQLAGCGTITNLLFYGGDHSAWRVRQSGGIDILLRAIKANPENAHLCSWACHVLATLVSMRSGAPGEDDYAGAVVDAGGLEVIAQATRNHMNQRDVLEAITRLQDLLLETLKVRKANLVSHR